MLFTSCSLAPWM